MEIIEYDPPKIITVTETLTYKRCRLLWHLGFQRKLAPQTEAVHFFVGRLTHRSLEEWDGISSIEEEFVRIITDETEGLKQRYLERVGAAMSAAEIDDKLEQSHLPLRMLENYAAYWGSPIPEGFELVQPEQTCIVDIPNTWHWRCDKCGKLIDGEHNILDGELHCSGNARRICMQLEGTLDGLVVDKITGRMYVLERKTYEKRPNFDVLNSAEQFTLYCWILRQLFPDVEIGGVLYDGLWKRESPPRGRSVDDLFCRELLPKTDAEIEQEGRYLEDIANEILRGPAIYPNRVWQGCYDDKDFNKLCAAIMKHDDSEVTDLLESDYVVRKNRWFEEDLNDE